MKPPFLGMRKKGHADKESAMEDMMDTVPEAKETKASKHKVAPKPAKKK